MMKNVFFWMAFYIILSAGCEKSVDNTSLAGKWKLAATLADPGDGSGTWQPASQYSYLQLHADGSVETHNFSKFKGYKVIDSITIELIRPDDTRVNYRYALRSASLELNPPCFEPCGFRFIRMY